ncbi:type II toxin-antitoxin system PemK/MazF family toxin [Erysipelothrix sp. D19-032]
MSYRRQKKQLIDNWTIDKKGLSDTWLDNMESIEGWVLEKGDVVLCDYGENLGSEYNTDRGELRPGVVISTKNHNHGIAIVAPTSTSKINKIRPFEYKLFKVNNPFLDRDTKVQVNAARCISAVRINKKVGKMTDSEISKLDIIIKRIFEI